MRGVFGIIVLKNIIKLRGSDPRLLEEVGDLIVHVGVACPQGL
jgi:hypothetical protein